MKKIVLIAIYSLGFISHAWGEPSITTLTSTKLTTSEVLNSFGKEKSNSPQTSGIRGSHLSQPINNSFQIKSTIEKNQLLQAGGVVNGGGGDARVIRSFILEAKRSHLMDEVIGVFSDINSNSNGVTTVKRLLSWISSGRMQLKNVEAQKILTDMIGKGFGKDLAHTKFVLSEKCLDSSGKEKTATAKMNEPRSDICVNPIRIVEDFGPYIQDSDLMGLMMHEFAHHYGYEDVDHSFAAAIALEYQLDNESRNQDGDPLNYLIK